MPQDPSFVTPAAMEGQGGYNRSSRYKLRDFPQPFPCWSSRRGRSHCRLGRSRS